MEPGTAYEIRREMRVREPKQTAIAWGRKYQNIDTGKFDSDKIPTLFSQSLGEIMSDNLCGGVEKWDYSGAECWPDAYVPFKYPKPEFDFDEEFKQEDEQRKQKAKKEAERQAQIAEDEKNREFRRQLRLKEQKDREERKAAQRAQWELDQKRIEKERKSEEQLRLLKQQQDAEDDYQRRVREREEELVRAGWRRQPVSLYDSMKDRVCNIRPNTWIPKK